MIEESKPTLGDRFASLFLTVAGRPLGPKRTQKMIIAIALAASLLASFYWVLIASSRYVSEAHVIVQRTDLPGGSTVDLGGILGLGNTGSRPDQMLLRDYMLSIDMLRKLDASLHLRQHYSDWHRDPLSRLWFENASIERFHAYFLSRVSVEFDDYSGLLVIKAEAFDPRMAQAIANTMVNEGQRFMNESAHHLATAQVRFLEAEVGRMYQRNLRARRAVLAYQDRYRLISPEQTSESLSGIVAQLEGRRAELETQLRALEAYLVPDHPQVVTVRQELEAVTRQIEEEKGKLASPNGQSLNQTTEEFQRLQMNAEFTQQVYNTTLAALERGRIDAMRTVKMLTVLQAPTLPEYPMRPRRFYNSLVFLLVAALLAGVAHLLAAIIRDHMD